MARKERQRTASDWLTRSRDFKCAEPLKTRHVVHGFHTLSLPEDRCMRLLKTWAKACPKLRSKRSWRHCESVCKPSCFSGCGYGSKTPGKVVRLHLTSASVARSPNVAEVRSLTEFYRLRMKAESYNAPKGPLQYKLCQRFRYVRRNCGCAPRCVSCGDANPSTRGRPSALAGTTLSEGPNCQVSRFSRTNPHHIRSWQTVRVADWSQGRPCEALIVEHQPPSFKHARPKSTPTPPSE
jgi:hypothetical protein